MEGSGPLVVDGSHGEGGGQILRTALALAAITSRPVRIVNIRAGRPRPGLAAQHLVSVRAAAAVCAAEVVGDRLGSTTLEFAPGVTPQPGSYTFDVAGARRGGSAGATSLVLQSILLPLALAGSASSLTLRGGTHVPFSPPFDYVREVWLPALAEVGIAAGAELRAFGWYPAGGGEIAVRVEGQSARPRSVDLRERGPLLRVRGRAVSSRLPAHVAQRMIGRARELLDPLGVPIELEAASAEAASPGAGIFLTAEYERCRAGANALGRRGRPAEEVAEEAAAALAAHHESGAALDVHLADQVLLPLALAAEPSHASVERVSGHLETSAWVIERFGLATVTVEPAAGATGLVSVVPLP